MQMGKRVLRYEECTGRALIVNFYKHFYITFLTELFFFKIEYFLLLLLHLICTSSI